MRINESVENGEGVWFQQSNSVDKETGQMEKIISEKSKIGKVDKKSSSDVHNFRALCKEFSDVSFIVVDEIGTLQSGYRGICNTSAFGDFGQISMMNLLWDMQEQHQPVVIHLLPSTIHREKIV